MNQPKRRAECLCLASLSKASIILTSSSIVIAATSCCEHCSMQPQAGLVHLAQTNAGWGEVDSEG